MTIREPVRTLACAALALLASCCRPDAPTGSEPEALRTIAFAGDTQLGRRLNGCVDQHGFSRPLERIRAPLVGADLAIVNLECVLSARGFVVNPETGRMFHAGGYHFRGRPELVRILADAGVDVAVLANNHAFDYGPDALLDGIRILDDAGIAAVGAGKDLDRAMAPVFRRIGDTAVAVIAVHSTNSGIAATGESPGNHFSSIFKAKAFVARVKAQVEAARERADVVLLAIHWGTNGVLEPTREMRDVARSLIRDAGVDAILGSHGHVLHGVEIVDGRPVIYDAGNLLLDFSGKGFMEGDWSRSAVFELRFDRRGVRRLEATPLRVDYCTSYPAEGALGAEILASFVKRSQALGTEVVISEGRAVVDLVPAKARPDPSRRYENPPPVAPKLPAPGASGSSNVLDKVPDGAKGVGAVFENGVELVGYLASERTDPGSWVWVMLFWRTAKPLAENCDASIRVRGDASKNEERWSGGIRPMGDWMSPATRWKPGQIIADEYVLRTPQDVKAGRYHLLVDLRSGKRPIGLVSPGSAAVAGNRLVIGGVEAGGAAPP